MMIAGVVIGIGMGVGMRKYDFDNLDAAYIAFPGTMLIQGLKMLVIPWLSSQSLLAYQD